MSDEVPPDRLGPPEAGQRMFASLATPIVRALVFVSPLLALASVATAAHRSFPFLWLVVVVLAGYCALFPDSNVGLLVLLVVGLAWLATVHHPRSAWSLALALSVAVFHTSMAAATVAAPRSTWTAAMARRWLQRLAVLGAVAALTWGFVAAVHGIRLPRSGLLFGVSLLAVAAGASWVRQRTTPPASDDTRR